jgi:hypothetical protein
MMCGTGGSSTGGSSSGASDMACSRPRLDKTTPLHSGQHAALQACSCSWPAPQWGTGQLTSCLRCASRHHVVLTLACCCWLQVESATPTAELVPTREGGKPQVRGCSTWQHMCLCVLPDGSHSAQHCAPYMCCTSCCSPCGMPPADVSRAHPPLPCC